MRSLLTSPSRAARISTVVPVSAAAEIRSKVAENQQELAAAFQLCHDAYVRSGLMLPNSSKMRILPHHLLPTSAVFVAVQEGVVVSTVSLIGDGQLGLPMECAFREEVAKLRDPSRWLGEVSSLANRRRQPFCRQSVAVNLTRLMAQYARRHGLEHMLVAVHPRHVPFYRRFLGFEPLGECKPHPRVCNHPGTPLLLDLPRLERERHPAYAAYFNLAIPDEELRFCPISSAARKFFYAMSAWQNIPLSSSAS